MHVKVPASAKRFVGKAQKMPAIAFVLAVIQRYGDDRGQASAAEITFYGFLSLFPLLLLAASMLGFVLNLDHGLALRIQRQLGNSVPGLASVISTNLDSVRQSRAGTGIFGLLGLLWSGTAVCAAAGESTMRIFGLSDSRNFVLKKLAEIRSTVVLGLIAFAGIAASAVAGSTVFHGVLGGAVRPLGVMIAIAADTALFIMAYRLLTPGRGPSMHRLWRGALFAAVGWNIIKIAASWFVSRSIAHSSAVFGAFATTAALLGVLNIAARLYLYGAEINVVRESRAEATQTLKADEKRFATLNGGHPSR